MTYRALPAGSAYHPFASATVYVTGKVQVIYPHLFFSLYFSLKKFRQWIYKVHPQNISFSLAQCANTQGTTTSTLRVSILELTTSRPPSTEAKNANVQKGPMSDTLSCPGIALYAHKYRHRHQSSGISMRFYRSYSTSRTMIDTFISRLTLHQYPQHHMEGFWTIFFRNKLRAST
ncbi:uncharacterized protein Bfra_000697 [Botrytis fragariae]|uniref:Uncharacterized protein n=1 Tax=Botrytis fragariae TaxID=1964551 RepID=A0A8H6B3J7_9HELO|nr:uncharacterized protein Bfra_000697 [Botrytis fragariae]KAF5878530.1 hypothetical protein Bfra_000697 [Botrytis fragariae]